MVNTKKTNKIILITSIIISIATFFISYLVLTPRFILLDETPAGLTPTHPTWWYTVKPAISNAVIGFFIAFCGLLGLMHLPKIIDNAIPKIMNYTKNKGLRRANLALGIIAIVPGFLWGISKCNSGFRRVPIEECIGMGVMGAIIFFLGTLFGVWGIIYLASWVYEGFKEEKTPSDKKAPTTRKKAR